MTPDEIQALREKHRLKVGDDCPDYCRYCHDIFPCDVIQVLDAWEAQTEDIVESIDYPHMRSGVLLAAIRAVLMGEDTK